MEATMKMDGRRKKNWAIMSFIPFIAWSVWFGYIMHITRPLIVSQTFQDHDKIVTILDQHYTSLAVIVLIAVLLTAAMLFYNVIHLMKAKNINAGIKGGWLVFMIATGAVSFPFFWYFHIRREPKNLPVYDNIS